MIQALRDKAKRLFERGFEGFGELPFPQEPLLYTEASIEEDSRRVMREFTGFVRSKEGERYFVFVEPGPEAKHLLFVVLVHPATGEYAGHVTLVMLPPTQELTCWSFYLEGIKGRGVGRALVERFSHYLPAGVTVTFRIEEKNTKGYLLVLIDSLIEEGKISNWRIGSKIRPIPTKDQVIAMSPEDQQVIERAFFEELGRQPWPIVRLMDHMGAKFIKLRAGLNDAGKFVFEGYAQITRNADRARAAA